MPSASLGHYASLSFVVIGGGQRAEIRGQRSDVRSQGRLIRELEN